jgi:phosphoribosylformimino-5-aminoimidazole carboxamide ribotide isomerase
MNKFTNLGVTIFLFTSISRDGLLVGPDYTVFKKITKRFRRGLFVAGGINSLNDLIRLKSENVDGVVVGKALYEGKFTLKEALDAVR